MKNSILKHLLVYFFLLTILSQSQAQRCWVKKEMYDVALSERLEKFTQEYIQGNKPATNRTNIEIPVVVHVVWNTEAENISDEQIFSQIDALNRDFQLLNADTVNAQPAFKRLIANAGFTFKLATIDEDGNETNGITRTETTSINVGAPIGQPRIFYTERTGRDAWDTEHYLNIWVASITDNNTILGYASIPGQNISEEDGVVIDYRNFGTIGTAQPPNHLGRTATHEIGHYFNLFHINGRNSNDCAVDDLVSDTPFQTDNYVGRCPNSTRTCNSLDLTTNYMNQGTDECLVMFTKGQVDRMTAALMGARSGLLETDITSSAEIISSADFLKVSPIPAREYLSIELLDINSPCSFQLIHSNGHIIKTGVLTQTQQQLLVSELPDGVYWLLVYTDRGVISAKVLLL